MKTASLALATALLCAAARMAEGAELKVLATPGVREFYAELTPQFERASGHRVTTEWAGTVDVMKRIGGGEIVDLVIAASDSIEQLIKLGKVAGRTDLARSGIGLAVRADAPRPDISSGETVKQALRAAKSIAYSSGPSGIYFAALTQRMGIADEIKSKMVQIPPGESVGALVARGEAEIGIHQMSELLPVKRIDIVGPLPPDIQKTTTFSAGRHVGTRESDAVGALVDFLAAPGAIPVIRKHGMDPG